MLLEHNGSMQFSTTFLKSKFYHTVVAVGVWMCARVF